VGAGNTTNNLAGNATPMAPAKLPAQATAVAVLQQ
jgi:hypothetical protein